MEMGKKFSALRTYYVSFTFICAEGLKFLTQIHSSWSILSDLTSCLIGGTSAFFVLISNSFGTNIAFNDKIFSNCIIFCQFIPVLTL